MLQTLALCSRSLSQVVSHSTFYATTAILTMINETWVANLAFFQRRWRLPHSCFVDRLGWIAEEDSVAIFVVLLIYNEDEPMFRDTFRTSALVFIAESAMFRGFFRPGAVISSPEGYAVVLDSGYCS